MSIRYPQSSRTSLYWQCQLKLEADSVATQLRGQALFVGRFEQSRSKVPVNFDGTADHAMREIVEFHLRALRVLRGCSLSVTLFSTLCVANAGGNGAAAKKL
jgi:hypothetical protein